MNGSRQVTVVGVALEWSSTAWLTQPGPKQLSRPECAAALSLLPSEPCPLRGQWD